MENGFGSSHFCFATSQFIHCILVPRGAVYSVYSIRNRDERRKLSSKGLILNNGSPNLQLQMHKAIASAMSARNGLYCTVKYSKLCVHCILLSFRSLTLSPVQSFRRNAHFCCDNARVDGRI